MKTIATRLRLASLLLVVLMVSAAGYAQITPSSDSYTNTATPTTNFGAKTLLDVDGATQVTYIQFNLASIPSGASISQATLKLYVNSVTTAGSFNVDYVSGTWTESTITADLAPALGNTIASGVAITTADKNQYILVNVSTAVQAWLSGSETNNGIALVADGTFNATFDSKESTSTSHPAELDIVFASSGGGGGITGVTAGTDLTGGGTSGKVTLNLDTTKVPQLATANTFVNNQTVNGTVSAAVFSGNGSGLTNVTAANSTELGGLASSAYAQVAANNAFSGNQTLNGTLGASTSATPGAVITGQSNATSGNTIGVYGISNSTTGDGVVGLNTAASGTNYGVYGATDSTAGYGVYGSSPFIGVQGNTSNIVGVQGQNSGAADGYGVAGLATATSGHEIGVLGQSVSTTGFGVVGVGATGMEGSGPIGVYGTDDGAADGTGVWGSDSSGNGVGVYATGYQGIIARGAQNGIIANTTSTSGLGIGVYGGANGGTGSDLSYYAGLWGDVGNTDGNSFAIIGTAAENGAGLFYNNGSAFTTLLAQNYAKSDSSALVFQTYGGYFGGECSFDVSGNLTCSGTVKDVVQVDGARKVAVYSMQSPENWFEDAGSGQLSNGVVRITLDPTFAQTVNTGVEYHVFLTPKGDCKGLYVANESAAGFEVHELGGGTASIAFDYRIMAKRVGYENVRLADLTEQSKREDVEHQKMQSRIHPAAAGPFPNLPAPPKVPAELKAPVLPKLPVLTKPVLTNHATMKPAAADQK